MLIAVIIVALVVIMAVVTVPRMRERSRPVRRVPVRRREPVDAMDEAEIRRERDRPREERVLIEEGQAIRAHVEARIDDERPAVARRTAVDGRTAEEIAWEVEQEQRERYGATYGAPGPANGEAGYVEGRDELARQLERDRRERFPEDYPPTGRRADGGLAGGGLQPELPPVSDALELQLQDAAVRSRRRVRPVDPPARMASDRRRAGFGGSGRDAVEQDDERWA